MNYCFLPTNISTSCLKIKNESAGNSFDNLGGTLGTFTTCTAAHLKDRQISLLRVPLCFVPLYLVLSYE